MGTPTGSEKYPFSFLKNHPQTFAKLINVSCPLSPPSPFPPFFLEFGNERPFTCILLGPEFEIG